MKMKKLFALVVATLAAATLSAQSGAVNYYGVDFSHARAFGAAEAGFQFKEAFTRINSLVITEWTKYSPSKFLDVEVAVRDISATTRANNTVDVMKIDTNLANYRLTTETIADMVRAYDIAEKEGTGLVIIAGLLDKSTATADYHVVWFDVASREVRECIPTSGRAHGFGLRNYWAGSLYAALRNVSK